MKNSLVTGASTGIGFTTALHLARNGYKTWATMRNPAAGQELLSRAKEEGLALDVIALDVTSEESMQAAMKQVMDADGKLDVLVNNAGISQNAPVELLQTDTLRSIMETNFFGASRMIQLALPSMRKNGHGAIVNISSVSGVFVGPTTGAYSASKFALEAMTEAAAMEGFQYGVRVVSIEPGMILTPIFDKVEQMELAPDAPYANLVTRLATWFEQGMPNAAPPQLVADAVLHAITTDEPKLRYLVGEDAQGLVAMQKGMSDEEKIALFGEPDDGVYWERIGQLMS